MCGICGCSDETHEVENHTDHHTSHSHDNKVLIEQDIMSMNNTFALNNKNYLAKQKTLALNIMSSPGSGKTTLLAKTISDLKNEIDMSVIVGDQQFNFDAEKIKSNGGRAIQINTGKACHLDAHTVGHVIATIPLKERSILFIENVGNLICPAMFNLGENYKVAVISVAEGDNKPLKYPDMFYAADLMIITKIDLLPYVDFDLNKCIEYARRIKPDIEILSLSSVKGDGL